VTALALAAASHQASTSAWDQPGTLGFLIVFGMGVILFFVFRSMSRHLRRVKEAAAREAEARNGQETAAGPDVPADDPLRPTGRPR
jgi:hypothetical protein